MNSTEPIDFFRHARYAEHRSSSCQLRYTGYPRLVLLTFILVHSSSVKSYARLSHDSTRIRMRSPLTRETHVASLIPQSHPDSPSGSDATNFTPVRDSDYSRATLTALHTFFNGVLRRDTAGSAPRAKAGVYIRRPQIHPGDHSSIVTASVQLSIACNSCL
jgi:hypothetical protein